MRLNFSIMCVLFLCQFVIESVGKRCKGWSELDSHCLFVSFNASDRNSLQVIPPITRNGLPKVDLNSCLESNTKTALLYTPCSTEFQSCVIVRISNVSWAAGCVDDSTGHLFKYTVASASKYPSPLHGSLMPNVLAVGRACFDTEGCANSTAILDGTVRSSVTVCCCKGVECSSDIFLKGDWSNKTVEMLRVDDLSSRWRLRFIAFKSALLASVVTMASVLHFYRHRNIDILLRMSA